MNLFDCAEQTPVAHTAPTVPAWLQSAQFFVPEAACLDLLLKAVESAVKATVYSDIFTQGTLKERQETFSFKTSSS